jgi:S-ribosylhomocysteine lyase
MHSLKDAKDVAQTVLDKGIGIMDNQALALDMSKVS